jgi:hypothetical protein
MTDLEHERIPEKVTRIAGFRSKPADTTIFRSRALRWWHEGAAILVFRDFLRYSCTDIAML